MNRSDWIFAFAEEFLRLRPNSTDLAATAARNQHPHVGDRDPVEAARAWVKASDALLANPKGGDAG